MKKILLGLALFISQIIYPFVSYHLLCDKNGNMVLVLGDCHRPQLDEFNEEHVQSLLSTIEEHQRKQHCYIEISKKSFERLGKKDAVQDRFIAKTALLLAQHAPNSKNIDFYPTDIRDNDLCDLNGPIGVISEFLMTKKIIGNNPKFDVILKIMVANNVKGIVGNVKQYIDGIREYINKTKEFLKVYDNDSLDYRIMNQIINELCINFEQGVETYFKDKKSNTSLLDALISCFKSCKDQNEAIAKAIELHENLLIKVDYLVAEINFLHQILQGRKKQQTRIIFVMGESHAKSVIPALNDVGYTLIARRSIYTEKNLVFQANIGDAAFSYYLPAMFLIFCNSEIYTIDSLQEVMDQINALIASKSKIKEEKKESKAPQENKCPRCSKPASKRCGQCKKIYYCSPECQKTDWPEHKAICNKKDAK